MLLEKTADKWGKNGNGDEWQEQWHERYKSSGEAEKSAYKWCSIDPNTELEAGHAHIWHERYYPIVIHHIRLISKSKWQWEKNLHNLINFVKIYLR